MNLSLNDIPGIGPKTADELAEHGIETVSQLTKLSVPQLARMPGFTIVRAAEVLEAMRSRLAGDAAEFGRASRAPPGRGTGGQPELDPTPGEAGGEDEETAGVSRAGPAQAGDGAAKKKHKKNKKKRKKKKANKKSKDKNSKNKNSKDKNSN